MTLPPRTADTMSDAIAMSSPNGRTSKRARDLAQKRLGEALFGPGGLKRPSAPQPDKRDRLLREAANLRDLASKGMRPRKFVKLAAELEAEAESLK